MSWSYYKEIFILEFGLGLFNLKSSAIIRLKCTDKRVPSEININNKI